MPYLCNKPFNGTTALWLRADANMKSTVFSCPSFQGTYTYCDGAYAVDHWKNGKYYGDVYDYLTTVKFLKLSQVRTPSRSFIYCDSISGSYGIDAYAAVVLNGAAPRHNGFVHFSFYDGHVESILLANIPIPSVGCSNPAFTGPAHPVDANFWGPGYQ